MKYSQAINAHMAAVIGLFLVAAPLYAAGEKVIDVTKEGVVGDGATVNTVSIQKAVDGCAASGGGTLVFPAGRYVTGTVEIKSNVVLRVEEGASILGSTNPADYRNLDPFVDGSGNPMGYALLVAVDAQHVGIEGKGTIDGRGPALKTVEKKFAMRPFLIRWVHCRDVVVKDVQLRDPGAWTLHFARTTGAQVEDVTIRTRTTKLQNNDGIDIDSSEQIQVKQCDINSEDDAIVIKATSPEPSRHIVVSDCRLSSHTNAIKLGTESYGGFEDVTVSHCHVYDTDMAGIALYQVDGGTLRDVTVSDVTIAGVQVPISIRLGARLKTFRDGERPKEVGELRNVTIKDVTAKNVKMIGMLINGVPGHPVTGLTLENIQMQLPGGGTAEAAKKELPEKEAAYPEFNMFGKTMPAYGIYARHVDGIVLEKVTMSVEKPDARPATGFVDVHNVTPEDFVEAGGGK